MGQTNATRGHIRAVNDLDRFGYYTVGPLKTYSKLEAIMEHDRTGVYPHWHFNEEVFGVIDWRQEPTEDLTELYRRRAQQIRDRYDYLVLWYSGGADSTNILQTFINNDIKLDEIAQFYSLEGDGDPDSNFNAEVIRVAIPWSLKITEEYRYIKHRVIDQSRLIESIYDQPEIKHDFLFLQNTTISPNNFSRVYLRKVVQDYADMISKGIRLCFIWGSEKPRISRVNGRYCLRFQDLIDNCVSPLIQQERFQGWHDELFYWSPDFAQGLVKQAHMVKKTLPSLPFNDTFFRKEHTPYGVVDRDNDTWYLTDHGLHSIIYPGWDINTFSVGKKRSPILSLRDSWYLNKQDGSTSRFMHGIKTFDSILSSASDGFWKNKTDLMDGVKGCLSPPYFIE